MPLAGELAASQLAVVNPRQVRDFARARETGQKPMHAHPTSPRQCALPLGPCPTPALRNCGRWWPGDGAATRHTPQGSGAHPLVGRGSAGFGRPSAPPLMEGGVAAERSRCGAILSDLPELRNRSEIPPWWVWRPSTASGALRGNRKVWGGRGQVRAAMYMAASNNPVLRLLPAPVCGRHPRKSLTACMRKLLTMLNAMVSTIAVGTLLFRTLDIQDSC